MKTILATIATIFVGLVALPEKVEARPHSGSGYTYASGHASCGCTSYTRRVVSSYDCYNRPIYSYYSVPVVHSCRSSYRGHSNHYSNHYSNGHNNHGYSSHRGHSTHRGHSSHNSRGITIRGPLGNIRIGR